jgi:hypothetical protein
MSGCSSRTKADDGFESAKLSQTHIQREVGGCGFKSERIWQEIRLSWTLQVRAQVEGVLRQGQADQLILPRNV